MASESTSPPSKKKNDDTDCLKSMCIVHVEGIKHGEIKLLSTIKDPETRLSRLHEIRRRRLTQPVGSAHRMENTCTLIPDALLPHHGYHQSCYQRFTMNLDRLKDVHTDTQATHSRSSRSSSTDHQIFKPDCIFCNSENRKKIKTRGVWSTEGMSVFDKDGWKNVLDHAEKKCDEKLLTRIRGYDLFACEANYHQSCRTQYIQDPSKWRSTNEEDKKKQKALEDSRKMP